MALSTSGYFLSQIIFLEASPTAFSNIGWKYYLVFLFGIVAFTIPTFFYYPETKGIPLEEIGRLFGDEAADVDLYATGDSLDKKVADDVSASAEEKRQ